MASIPSSSQSNTPSKRPVMSLQATVRTLHNIYRKGEDKDVSLKFVARRYVDWAKRENVKDAIPNLMVEAAKLGDLGFTRELKRAVSPAPAKGQKFEKLPSDAAVHLPENPVSPIDQKLAEFSELYTKVGTINFQKLIDFVLILAGQATGKDGSKAEGIRQIPTEAKKDVMKRISQYLDSHPVQQQYSSGLRAEIQKYLKIYEDLLK